MAEEPVAILSETGRWRRLPGCTRTSIARGAGRFCNSELQKDVDDGRVILIVLLMGVGAGAYFAGRSYGTIGIIVVIGVDLTFIYGLYALGAISFIK